MPGNPHFRNDAFRSEARMAELDDLVGAHLQFRASNALAEASTQG